MKQQIKLKKLVFTHLIGDHTISYANMLDNKKMKKESLVIITTKAILKTTVMNVAILYKIH